MNILLLESSLKKNISLMKFLSNIYPNAEQYHLYSSFNNSQAYKIAKQVTIDLFLVGIEQNHTGFEFVHQIRAIEKYEMTWLIYYAADYNHVHIAIKTRCIDYLITPIDEVKLKERLGKVVKYLPVRKKKPSVFLKYKSDYYNIEQDDIYYIEVVEKNLYIKTVKGYMKLGRIPIKEIAGKLSEETFFQCNRSSIINVERIRKIQYANGGWEVSFAGIAENIYMSNSRKAVFEDKYKSRYKFIKDKKNVT